VCLASCAKILSKATKFLPPFPHPCCCALSSLLPFCCLSLVQASPPFVSYIRSDFSFPYTFSVRPLRRARVQLRDSYSSRYLSPNIPTHGISNGNGNSSSISTTAKDVGCGWKKNAILIDSPQGIACPRLLLLFAASRPFREMLGPCRLPHDVTASQVAR
jgi:hypothetical protein